MRVRRLSLVRVCQDSLLGEGVRVLHTPNPMMKSRITVDAVSRFKRGDLVLGDPTEHVSLLHDYPCRLDRPELVEPSAVPDFRRSGLQSQSLYVLLGLAHIELTAVDCYWDTMVRFSGDELPPEFFQELASVVLDEARHFQMVENRIRELGSFYGKLPAHKSLWDLAKDTKLDLKARLAVIPLAQEARGLDAGPRLLQKVRTDRDRVSAAIVKRIVEEEERHVAFGLRWFKFLCQREDLDPVDTFHSLIRKYIPAGLFPPFNVEARLRCGLEEKYYIPLAAKIPSKGETSGTSNEKKSF